MEVKKPVVIAVSVTVIFALGIGAMMAIPEDHDAAEIAAKARAQAERTAAKPPIGNMSGSGGGSGEASDPRISLERRLRLFDVADHIQRGRIVHSIRTNFVKFEPFLEEIIYNSDTGVLRPGILVTGRLELIEHENRLFELADAEAVPIRAASIRALGVMRRWSVISAVKVLEHEKDPTVLLAALEATLILAQRPIPSILPLLAHTNWDVVRAARRAIPDELSEDEITLISKWTRNAKPGAAISGIQVLSALNPSTTRDRLLVEHASTAEWSIQEACFEALARDAGPLEETGPIWTILEDPKGSNEVKVYAFLVLERTKTIEVPRIRRQIDNWHPVVKLAAARCLLVMGDPDGSRVLVGLLDTKEGPEVDDEDRTCAIEGAHELLVEISKQEFEPFSAAWSRWLRDTRVRSSGALMSPPRLAW